MGYANYEWFLKTDLSDYAGKWVAIIDQKIVASEKSVEKLMIEVKHTHPKGRPLISKVNNKLSVL